MGAGEVPLEACTQDYAVWVRLWPVCGALSSDFRDGQTFSSLRGIELCEVEYCTSSVRLEMRAPPGLGVGSGN